MGEMTLRPSEMFIFGYGHAVRKNRDIYWLSNNIIPAYFDLFENTITEMNERHILFLVPVDKFLQRQRKTYGDIRLSEISKHLRVKNAFYCIQTQSHKTRKYWILDSIPDEITEVAEEFRKYCHIVEGRIEKTPWFMIGKLLGSICKEFDSTASANLKKRISRLLLKHSAIRRYAQEQFDDEFDRLINVFWNQDDSFIGELDKHYVDYNLQLPPIDSKTKYSEVGADKLLEQFKLKINLQNGISEVNMIIDYYSSIFESIPLFSLLNELFDFIYSLIQRVNESYPLEIDLSDEDNCASSTITIKELIDRQTSKYGNYSSDTFIRNALKEGSVKAIKNSYSRTEPWHFPKQKAIEAVDARTNIRRKQMGEIE